MPQHVDALASCFTYLRLPRCCVLSGVSQGFAGSLLAPHSLPLASNLPPRFCAPPFRQWRASVVPTRPAVGCWIPPPPHPRLFPRRLADQTPISFELQRSTPAASPAHVRPTGQDTHARRKSGPPVPSSRLGICLKQHGLIGPIIYVIASLPGDKRSEVRNRAQTALAMRRARKFDEGIRLWCNFHFMRKHNGDRHYPLLHGS